MAGVREDHGERRTAATHVRVFARMRLLQAGRWRGNGCVGHRAYRRGPSSAVVVEVVVTQFVGWQGPRSLQRG